MAKMNINERIGELKWTKGKIESNLAEDWWGCDEDHYPQVYDASKFDRETVKKRKQQSTVLADCVMIPDAYKLITLPMVREMEYISWLHRDEDTMDDVLAFVNRTREKHGLVLVIPVLDKSEYERCVYDKPLTVVCYLLTNRTEAIVLRPELHIMAEIMKLLLEDKDIAKVVINHEYDMLPLMTNFGCHIRSVFSIARALAVMMERLGVTCQSEGNNPMPCLSRVTRIALPVISENVYKSDRILKFAEGIYKNLEFLIRFKEHRDNNLSLRRFGMDWTRVFVLEQLSTYLPRKVGNDEFWKEIVHVKNTCAGYPYYVAAILFCKCPLLVILDVKDPNYKNQDDDNVAIVYREFLKMSETEEKYRVDKGCYCSRCMKGALVNWIKFDDTIDICEVKYDCIAPLLKMLRIYAPQYCYYVQSYT